LTTHKSEKGAIWRPILYSSLLLNAHFVDPNVIVWDPKAIACDPKVGRDPSTCYKKIKKSALKSKKKSSYDTLLTLKGVTYYLNGPLIGQTNKISKIIFWKNGKLKYY